MYDQKTRLLVRRLCGAALAANALSLTAVAQQAAPAEEPIQMEKIVVTGSLIPTAETVGPAPVDMVGAQAIQNSGGQDVLEVLKRMTPVFSGNGNVGQTVNNGGGGESYIAVRNLPTLVLLDGRRMANSAFSSGGLVDLNTIPVAMIERIEVLKDGASAIYGSQAIGGVVNVITKKNFNGAEVGGRYGMATDRSSMKEYSAYIVAGASTDKTSITAGANYYHQDPLLSMDTETAGLTADECLANNIYPSSHLSPSFPGRVQAGGVSYVLAGSPFAVGHAEYNASVVAPPIVSGGPFSGASAIVNYNNAALAQVGYRPYIPIRETPLGQRLEQALVPTGLTGEQAAWPLLNTPAFGTHSIQSQDRVQAFANGSHEIFDTRMEVFGSFLFANTDSEGVLAPSPVSSLGANNITIPANDPNNPFGIALGLNSASTPRVRSRFVDVGNRLFDAQNDYYRFVGGLRGQFESGWRYEGAYNYSRNDQAQYTRNAVNGAALDLATTPNAANPALSMLKDANGNYVPLYNMFSLPGTQSAATAEALRTTQFQTGVSEFSGADFSFSGEPVTVPAGKLAIAAGGGAYSEMLSLDVDGLTKMGKIPGLNPAGPTPGGARDAWNLFTEFRVPIFSPDYNLPGFHALEVTAAVRHESFDPGGDSTVPKVGLRWQPVDQITMRGNYSQGFLAPTVYNLFGGPQVSFPAVSGADGALGQAQYVYKSTASLTPSKAENFGAGIVLSPKCMEGLTVSVDYYHIQTKDDIYRPGDQYVINDLNANGAASKFAAGYKFDDGSTLADLAATGPGNDLNAVTIDNWGSVDVGLENGAEQMTDGIDVAITYEKPTESLGKFTVYAAANILFNYTYTDPGLSDNGRYGPFHYEGQYTDGGPAGGAQGMLPDYVINAGVTWDYKNFMATINARYVPEVDDLGTLHESYAPDGSYPYNDFTVDMAPWTIDSYYRIDMQVAYEFGKTKEEKAWYDGTRVALGVNNITDTQPNLIASSFEDLTDKSTYDPIGRFFYVELTKKF